MDKSANPFLGIINDKETLAYWEDVRNRKAAIVSAASKAGNIPMIGTAKDLPPEAVVGFVKIAAMAEGSLRDILTHIWVSVWLEDDGFRIHSIDGSPVSPMDVYNNQMSPYQVMSQVTSARGSASISSDMREYVEKGVDTLPPIAGRRAEDYHGSSGDLLLALSDCVGALNGHFVSEAANSMEFNAEFIAQTAAWIPSLTGTIMTGKAFPNGYDGLAAGLAEHFDNDLVEDFMILHSSLNMVHGVRNLSEATGQDVGSGYQPYGVDSAGNVQAVPIVQSLLNALSTPRHGNAAKDVAVMLQSYLKSGQSAEVFAREYLQAHDGKMPGMMHRLLKKDDLRGVAFRNFSEDTGPEREWQGHTCRHRATTGN